MKQKCDILCELKESQITFGSVKGVLEQSLFNFHTNAGPHPKEKKFGSLQRQMLEN